MEKNTFELVGVNMMMGFINLKQILPLISDLKIKTKHNDIIRGKWHKKK